MKRWIAGLDPAANLVAILCLALTIAAGMCMGIIVVAEKLSTTNGSAGVLPALIGIAFFVLLGLLYMLLRGKLWARLVATVMALASWVASLAMVLVHPDITPAIISFCGGIVILSSLSLGLLWTPIPPKSPEE